MTEKKKPYVTTSLRILPGAHTAGFQVVRTTAILTSNRSKQKQTSKTDQIHHHMKKIFKKWGSQRRHLTLYLQEERVSSDRRSPKLHSSSTWAQRFGAGLGWAAAPAVVGNCFSLNAWPGILPADTVTSHLSWGPRWRQHWIPRCQKTGKD